MAINEIIANFVKKNLAGRINNKLQKIKILNLNLIVLLSLFILITVIFFSISNYISLKNNKNYTNLKNIADSNDFSKLTNFFLTKINSPYEEVKYLIKNKDSIEKILNNLGINRDDVSKISKKLKKKNLSNIYTGRELSLIFKKLDNDEKTVINLIYPINKQRVLR